MLFKVLNLQFKSFLVLKSILKKDTLEIKRWPQVELFVYIFWYFFNLVRKKYKPNKKLNKTKLKYILDI